MDKKVFQHDQHFLINKEVLSASIKAAELKKEDQVLEIGPGKGILTQELAKKCKKVIAIEIDESLKEDLACLPKNVDVLFGNALELMDYQPFNKIVANISFSISEPLFKKLLKTKFDLAVLLTGESFYQLLREESKWSIAAKLYFEVEKVLDVPRDAFDPRPRVDSVLIKITPRSAPLTKKEMVLKELFSQNDKKLKNALMFALMRVFNLTKNQAKDKIEDLKIYTELQNKRIDHLSNVQFKFLLDKLKSI